MHGQKIFILQNEDRGSTVGYRQIWWPKTPPVVAPKAPLYLIRGPKAVPRAIVF